MWFDRRVLVGIAIVGVTLGSAAVVGAQRLEEVCGEGELPFGTTTGEPTFEVADSGILAWQTEDAGTAQSDGRARFRLRLERVASAVVRVELVASATDQGISLGCGVVASGAVVEVHHVSSSAEGRRILRIAVFRPLEGADETARVAPALEARIHEVESDARRDAFVGAYEFAIVHGAADASGRDPVDLPAVSQRLDRMDSACASPASTELLFSSALCREVTTLRALVTAGDANAVANHVTRPDVTAAFCEDYRRLRSDLSAASTRLVAAFDLPWTTDRVVITAFDDGVRGVETARGHAVGGILVVDVPSSLEQVTFRRRTGEAVSSSLAVALGRFGRLAGGLIGAADIGNFAPCEGRRADSALPPAAPVGTRAYTLRDFDWDHVTELDVCQGTACTDESLRSTLRVVPRRSIEFAVLIEGAMDWLPIQASGSGSPHTAYTQPRYRAVGGSQGAEQLYIYEDETRVGRLFTLSALIGVTFPLLGETRGMAGLGVALFDGEGRRSFTEAGLRFGIEVTSHVFITLGVGLTRLPLDVDPGQARAVAVPRTGGAGTTPPPPTLQPGDAWVASVSTGLAIDLALFGGAADDIVKALGGH